MRSQKSALPLAAEAASLIEDETLRLHYAFVPFMNIGMESAAVTVPISLEL